MRHLSIARPFSLFDDLNHDFDALFNSKENSQKRWKPESKLFEKEESLLLSLDIPGVSKEDLSVELKDEVLKVSGVRKNKFINDQQEGLKFESKFSLPENIDLEKIDVRQENGVLGIILPKQVKKDIVKNIEIKSGWNQI